MVYVIAEAGINHNGDPDIAVAMVKAAADAGCDAVKFQVRTPDLCTPPDQWDVMRETPWGRMRYIDYRHRIELDVPTLERIDRMAKECRIDWFASCFDEPSVDRIAKFDPPAFKVASASITDLSLLVHMADLGTRMYVSTGMSKIHEVDAAVAVLPRDRTVLLHAVSVYPCPPELVNLPRMGALARRYNLPVGYSGHETGLAPTLAAVAMGAPVVERHFTLDRAMWGTDQAASVEPVGMRHLVRDIRVLEDAMSDCGLDATDAEEPARLKLRRR